jgi:hypothetical protein
VLYRVSDWQCRWINCKQINKTHQLISGVYFIGHCLYLRNSLKKKGCGKDKLAEKKLMCMQIVTLFLYLNMPIFIVYGPKTQHCHVFIWLLLQTLDGSIKIHRAEGAGGQLLLFVLLADRDAGSSVKWPLLPMVLSPKIGSPMCVWDVEKCDALQGLPIG